ncbi:MAG: 1,4-alpha-glucan branching protein domain-containing protein [Methylococcaceae bacterium]
MKNGFVSIILHAHLPYVRHPEHDGLLEERWLFEAITECYIPLIRALDRLQAEAIPCRLTLSLSPPLITMLCDELLRSRYLQHLNALIELSEKEITRTRKQPELQVLARLYRRFFINTLAVFQTHYACDLLQAFKKHQESGRLELMTCAATHGFLPLLNVNASSVRNQIKIGLDTFNDNFGFYPKGFWLPECGFYPGLEEILGDFDIQYFLTDTHGILHASQRPNNDVYAPLDCGNGVMAFGRDPESSKQVWSSHEGYPGDYEYREYHQDIGFELDLDYLAPCMVDQSIRVNTGIKYHRVTGHDLPKAIYQPRAALAKATMHAEDFLQKRQQQLARLADDMDRPPIVVAPYDAELFGHWWFEGPHWLEGLFRGVEKYEDDLQLVSCSDYLSLVDAHQVSIPSASTWGDQGYSNFWINETNAWIYPFLHQAGREMEQLATEFAGGEHDFLIERALNQAARSLLLAQASDWPFILKSGTTIDYAKKRITDHLARFNYLQNCIRKNTIEERNLVALEVMDNVFPNIDFRDYASSTK